MAFARFERPITDEAGNIVMSAYVEVRREVPGFPLAVPIYADIDGAVTKDNPFHVSDGIAVFHAVGGLYRIRVYAPGYERVYRYVPLGTAQAADIDAYARAGFTWAPESATATPPSAGCIRFDDDDVSLAQHVYLDRHTLGNSDVATWLDGLSAEDRLMLSTGVGVEVGWPVLSVTHVTADGDDYYDIEVDDAAYAGPAGPLSFGDSGFVSVSRERRGARGFTPRGAWDDATTYATGDLISHSGEAFVSNQDGNLNHEPDGADAWWTPVGSYSGLVMSTDASVADIIKITQAAYDALDPPIATTLYIIIDED